MEYENYVVCHGDINHNNWLLTDEVNQLYLIDWDGPMIADPALDIGMLLYLYISNEDWDQWLEQYGIEETDSLHMRMKWYVISQILLSIQWHKDKNRLDEMNHWIDFLESIV
jgi:thiamine kinase-like enzyme